MAGTFRQLEIFALVCQSGSFSAAAEAEGISQAAVSRHINALERAVGKQLFRRQIGKINQLSADGEAVLGDALQALESGRRIGHIAPARRRVRVGADQMILNLHLLPARDRLTELFRELEIDFIAIEAGRDPLENMSSSELDLLYFTEGADELYLPSPVDSRPMKTGLSLRRRCWRACPIVRHYRSSCRRQDPGQPKASCACFSAG